MEVKRERGFRRGRQRHQDDDEEDEEEDEDEEGELGFIDPGATIPLPRPSHHHHQQRAALPQSQDQDLTQIAPPSPKDHDSALASIINERQLLTSPIYGQRIIDLLIRNLTPQDALTRLELEELMTIKEQLHVGQWEDWVDYAWALKRRSKASSSSLLTLSSPSPEDRDDLFLNGSGSGTSVSPYPPYYPSASPTARPLLGAAEQSSTEQRVPHIIRICTTKGGGGEGGRGGRGGSDGDDDSHAEEGKGKGGTTGSPILSLNNESAAPSIGAISSSSSSSSFFSSSSSSDDEEKADNDSSQPRRMKTCKPIPRERIEDGEGAGAASDADDGNDRSKRILSKQTTTSSSGWATPLSHHQRVPSSNGRTSPPRHHQTPFPPPSSSHHRPPPLTLASDGHRPMTPPRVPPLRLPHPPPPPPSSSDGHRPMRPPVPPLRPPHSPSHAPPSKNESNSSRRMSPSPLPHPVPPPPPPSKEDSTSTSNTSNPSPPPSKRESSSSSISRSNSSTTKSPRWATPLASAERKVCPTHEEGVARTLSSSPSPPSPPSPTSKTTGPTPRRSPSHRGEEWTTPRGRASRTLSSSPPPSSPPPPTSKTGTPAHHSPRSPSQREEEWTTSSRARLGRSRSLSPTSGRSRSLSPPPSFSSTLRRSPTPGKAVSPPPSIDTTLRREVRAGGEGVGDGGSSPTPGQKTSPTALSRMHSAISFSPMHSARSSPMRGEKMMPKPKGGDGSSSIPTLNRQTTTSPLSRMHSAMSSSPMHSARSSLTRGESITPRQGGEANGKRAYVAKKALIEVLRGLKEGGVQGKEELIRQVLLAIDRLQSSSSLSSLSLEKTVSSGSSSRRMMTPSMISPKGAIATTTGPSSRSIRGAITTTGTSNTSISPRGGAAITTTPSFNDTTTTLREGHSSPVNASSSSFSPRSMAGSERSLIRQSSPRSTVTARALVKKTQKVVKKNNKKVALVGNLTSGLSEAHLALRETVIQGLKSLQEEMITFTSILYRCCLRHYELSSTLPNHQQRHHHHHHHHRRFLMAPPLPRPTKDDYYYYQDERNRHDVLSVCRIVKRRRRPKKGRGAMLPVVVAGIDSDTADGFERPYVQVGRTRDTPSYRYGFDVVIGGEQEGGEYRATAADYEEEDESEDIIFDQLSDVIAGTVEGGGILAILSTGSKAAGRSSLLEGVGGGRGLICRAVNHILKIFHQPSPAAAGRGKRMGAFASAAAAGAGTVGLIDRPYSLIDVSVSAVEVAQDQVRDLLGRPKAAASFDRFYVLRPKLSTHLPLPRKDPTDPQRYGYITNALAVKLQSLGDMERICGVVTAHRRFCSGSSSSYPSRVPSLPDPPALAAAGASESKEEEEGHLKERKSLLVAAAGEGGVNGGCKSTNTSSKKSQEKAAAETAIHALYMLDVRLILHRPPPPPQEEEEMLERSQQAGRKGVLLKKVVPRRRRHLLTAGGQPVPTTITRSSRFYFVDLASERMKPRILDDKGLPRVQGKLGDLLKEALAPTSSVCVITSVVNDLSCIDETRAILGTLTNAVVVSHEERQRMMMKKDRERGRGELGHADAVDGGMEVGEGGENGHLAAEEGVNGQRRSLSSSMIGGGGGDGVAEVSPFHHSCVEKEKGTVTGSRLQQQQTRMKRKNTFSAAARGGADSTPTSSKNCRNGGIEGKQATPVPFR